ncbi:MAG: hypothetical protein Q8N88_05615 [Nanoarchaeota archaeon]|nr:hypothetical protein [Nanoarchaeota archaeon]
MIRLNLLPIEEKKKIKLDFLQCNIIFSGLFLILLILILILILSGSLIFLNSKLYSIGQETMLQQSKIVQTETVKSIERKVKELNSQLIDLDRIIKNQSNFYNVLLDIVPELLSKVEVYTIDIEKETKKITITGYSSTRDDLLLIKKTLESSVKYKIADFPNSNLINPKDINFRFSLTYE